MPINSAIGIWLELTKLTTIVLTALFGIALIFTDISCLFIQVYFLIVVSKICSK